MIGIVRFFNEQKGYGLITSEDGGQDTFVSITQCPVDGTDSKGRKRYMRLTEGDIVSYEITKEKAKTEAVNIVFVEHNGNDYSEGEPM